MDGLDASTDYISDLDTWKRVLHLRIDDVSLEDESLPSASSLGELKTLLANQLTQRASPHREHAGYCRPCGDRSMG